MKTCPWCKRPIAGAEEDIQRRKLWRYSNKAAAREYDAQFCWLTKDLSCENAPFELRLAPMLFAADLQTRVTELEGALSEAIESIESWAAYASEYFQQKHDLAGDLAKFRATLQKGGEEK